MTDETTEAPDDEGAMFGLLADAYPQEAYEAFPERFWLYFRAKCPGVSREAMERLLREETPA